MVVMPRLGQIRDIAPEQKNGRCRQCSQYYCPSSVEIASSDTPRRTKHSPSSERCRSHSESLLLTRPDWHLEASHTANCSSDDRSLSWKGRKGETKSSERKNIGPKESGERCPHLLSACPIVAYASLTCWNF